ncbi:MAG: hypothetical protein QXT90_00160 [Candidatus Caldarchaeum sp.]
MPRSREWATVKIPKPLADAIDRFIMTDECRIRGIKSRSDFVVRVVYDYLKDANCHRRL